MIPVYYSMYPMCPSEWVAATAAAASFLLKCWGAPLCWSTALSNHHKIIMSLSPLLWSLVMTVLWCSALLCHPHSVELLDLPTVLLTPSVLGHIFYHEFWVQLEVLLILGRVYGGQKINSQRLCYFNPHVSLWSCIKSRNDKQNEYESASQYWRRLISDTHAYVFLHTLTFHNLLHYVLKL